MTRPARLPPGVQQCSAPPPARPAAAVVAPRRSAVATALLLVTGLLGTTAGMPLGAAPASADAAPAAAIAPDGRERRHARRLHRARLRPVPRPRPALDEPLAHPLAVPGRRHLHLRQLPRLPRPAEPHAAVDRHPAGQGLAAAADHPRPAGVLPAALPAGTTTTRRSTRSAAPTAATSGPATRAPPRPPRPSASPRRWASRRAARSGTTSRASTTTSATAASPRWRSCRRGPTSCTRSGTSPASTPAPAPASRCSTTPASSGPARSRLPDQIWIARWDGNADTSTSYIREDGWVPGGRMKQYQGGHDETWGGVRINIDRNYLDLGLGSVATRETHCDGTRVSYWRYPAAAARRHEQGRARAAVPAQGEGLLRRPDLRHVRRQDGRRRRRLDERPGARRARRSSPRGTGSRCSARAASRC